MSSRPKQVEMEIDNDYENYHLSFDQKILMLSQLIDNSRVDSIIENWQFERHAPSKVQFMILLRRLNKRET